VEVAINALFQGFLEDIPQFEWILLRKVQNSCTVVLSRFSFIAILLRTLLFCQKKKKFSEF
jgi:hypothetical protein